MRQRTYAPAVAVALIVIALAAMIVAGLVSDRVSRSRRAELAGEIEPFSITLNELEEDAFRISADTNFILIDDGGFQERLASDRSQLDATLASFGSRGERAGYGNEAAALMDAARRFEDSALRGALAWQAGNQGDAERISGDEGVRNLDAFLRIADDLELRVDADVDGLRADIGDIDNIERLVLIGGGAIAAIAIIFLVWLLTTSQRLARDVERRSGDLDDVVSNVPGVVWRAWGRPDSASQRIDFVSDYVETMLGYSVAEWLATPNFWLTIVHPDDRERAGAEGSAIFQSGEPGQNEFRWLARDGRVLDVIAHSTVVRDQYGRPAGMRGVTIDITKQKRAERALALTAAIDRILIASDNVEASLPEVADAIVERFADWSAIHVVTDGTVAEPVLAHRDPALLRLARDIENRYPPNPDLPRGAFNVLRTGKSEFISEIPDRPVDPNLPDAAYLEEVRTLGLVSYICAPIAARGRMLGAVTAVSAESGRHFDETDVAVCEEIGRRIAFALEADRLQAAIANERARFEAMVESVGYGVYEIDTAGRLRHLNPEGARLLGRTLDELRDRSVHEAVHHTRPDGTPYPASECPFERVARSGIPFAGQETFVRPDGSFLPVEAHASPIVSGGWAARGAVVVFQDITERLRQEQMKDDYIAFASHELRSPLTSLSGLSKWLDRHAAAQPERFDEDSREAIETVASEAGRMIEIVEVFLDLARVESGRFTMEADKVDLSELVRAEAEAATQRNPHIRIDLALPEGACIASTDEGRLRQVLTNLLDNAGKYAGDSPLVKLSLAKRDGTAIIEVADDGDGIAPEEQAHIFDRLYRGAADVTAGKKGLGVGLFIAKQIIARLGGTLTLRSAPGAGATFTVRLPTGSPD